MVYINVLNTVLIDTVYSFDNINGSMFGTFGWKMPIHASQTGVLELYDPLNGQQYQQKPERHTVA